MKSRLFWTRKQVTVREDGLAQFQIKNQTYQFQIYEPKAFFSLQRSLVKIYYDELNLTEIHVFDEQNRFHGSVQLRKVHDSGDLSIIEHHRLGRKEINAFAKKYKKKWDQSASVGKRSSKKGVLPLEYHDYLVQGYNDSDKEIYMKLNQI